MSRVYYEIDADLEAHHGDPIGNGWRHLGSQLSPDGEVAWHVLWKPSTGERMIYCKPVHVREASPLMPPAPEHVRVKRVRRGHR